MIEQEKTAVDLLKTRRSKLRGYLMSIFLKLLKNPIEALEYDMTLKTVIGLMTKIGEKVTPVMLGGDFLDMEKILLIELGELYNKWITGKKFINDNRAVNEARNLKKASIFDRQTTQSIVSNRKMFPNPDTIISTLCRKGSSEALKIFSERKLELDEAKRNSPVVLNGQSGAYQNR